ncbi:hypothetical protein KIN20_036203 [Parelaphostrongylus tenuis]|uniref:MARVEL domain-containing protein n=1 Tax=Parelaphostrongylus tenuis TaxID=148309 RepID=A0AAD5WL48_PARTN|nr:hypothetical protein KIN20_036203 [Parelaphostrongylus tenuis]
MSHRHVLKIIELTVLALSLLLIGESRAVSFEKNIALLVCLLGLVGTLAILAVYAFDFHFLFTSTRWFVLETVYGTIMVVGLLTAAILLLIFCAKHWEQLNLLWQALPSLASGTLFICCVLYSIDLYLLLINWKRYSWHLRPHQFSTEIAISQ